MQVPNEFVLDSDDKILGLKCGAVEFGLHKPTIFYYIQKLSGTQHVKGSNIRDFSTKNDDAKVKQPGVL